MSTLLSGFQGPIEGVPVPLRYRFGLLVVAIAMVLIPILYAALVALCGYGVYYHAANHWGVARGLVGLLLYLGPIAIGGILLVFMLKPFVAGPAVEHEPRAITPEEQPELFAFVARLCEVVGAPQPSEIRVDCSVNASASYQGGLWGVLTNRLVLTVGLPLVAGMNLRQVTGVLAHEFGHFAQGTGMRVTFVIRTISAWLARVSNERDAWDEWLERAAEAAEFRIGIVLQVARLMVWLTQKILWGLMLAGYGISCFLLRQMEFDADRYEARVAGSDVFALTATRLQTLSLAASWAQSDLAAAWQEKKLPDDFPATILANVDQLPGELLEQIQTRQETVQTEFFDTHPCDRERIASAKQQGASGVFQLEVPASELFADFGAVCLAASIEHYVELTGEAIDAGHLVPTADVVALGRALNEVAMTYRKFFGAGVSWWRPLIPAADAADAAEDRSFSELLEHVHEIRAQVETVAEANEPTIEAMDAADDELLRTAHVGSVLQAGYTLSDDNDIKTVGDATRAYDDAARAMQSAVDELAGQDALVLSRLSLAFDLLNCEELDARLPERAELQEEARRLNAALTGLAEPLELAKKLRPHTISLRFLNGQYDESGTPDDFAAEWRSQGNKIRALLVTLQAGLVGIEDPLPAIGETTDLATRVVPTLPPKGAPLGLLEASDHAVRHVERLYIQLMGRLAVVVQQVEDAAEATRGDASSAQRAAPTSAAPAL